MLRLTGPLFQDANTPFGVIQALVCSFSTPIHDRPGGSLTERFRRFRSFLRQLGPAANPPNRQTHMGWPLKLFLYVADKSRTCRILTTIYNCLEKDRKNLPASGSDR